MPLVKVAEPDPLAPFNLYRDMYIGDKKLDLRELVVASTGSPRCTATRRARTCTRPEHPAWWRHVASDGAYVLDLWDGEPVPVFTELQDPEDGTPQDPADVMARADIHLGHCYRLRDRRNLLYVIGGADEYQTIPDIEVLDLNRREYRRIPVTEMVPTPDTLTLEELGWVAKYTAELRRNVVRIGVDKYRKDLWCMGGLNEALGKLGIPRYEPELHGKVSIRIPFSAQQHAGKSQLEAELRKFLQTVDVSGIQPDNDELDLKVDHANVEIVVTDLVRR